MRLEERRTLKVVLGLGALGALAPVVFLTGLLFLGMSVAPTPPAIEGTPAPPLFKHALWARAGGGRAPELRSVNPINVIGHIACRELAEVPDNPRPEDQIRADECADWLPAIQGIEYLANLHIRDLHVERNSFRGGAGSMATAVRLTHSWTREEFLNTLAARADFGFGWKGVEAAAQGFFGRPPAALTLSQSAFLASRVGDTRTDPWCSPDVAAAMRNRVLTRMQANGAVSQTDFQSASIAELGLTSLPEGRPACKE